MAFGGFGVSAGDIITVGNFAWNIYRACKSASAEFEEVAREVSTLHTAIKELGDEAQTEGSILNRTEDSKKTELDKIIRNCQSALVQLENLLTRYKSLGTKSKRTWDRIRFGTEGLQAIREKLTFHTSSINLFLTTLGTGSLGRIEKKLDEIVEEIRDGRREATILTAADDDNEDGEISWDILKNELLDEGFTRQELEGHKLDLKAYLQDLVGHGKARENIGSTSSHQPPATQHQSAGNSTTTESNVKSHDCVLLSRKSPPLNPQEQNDAILPQKVRSHSLSLTSPSQLYNNKDSENLGIEVQSLDLPQPMRCSTKEGTAFSLESDSFRRPQRRRIQVDLPPTIPPLRSPSTQSSSFKRPASSMSEEYREESSEFDGHGRLRKRTVIQRSNSSSPAMRQSPNLYNNLGSSQNPPLVTSDSIQSPVGPGSQYGFFAQKPIHHQPSNGLTTCQLTAIAKQDLIQASADVQAAIELADVKRKRNAGASERFLHRRKEREREATLKISGLEDRICQMVEESELYQTERDHFHTLLEKMTQEKELYQTERDYFCTLLKTSPDSQQFLQQQETIKELKQRILALETLVQNPTSPRSPLRAERSYRRDSMNISPTALESLREQPHSPQMYESSVRIESPIPVTPPGGQQILRRMEEALETEVNDLMDISDID